VNSSAFLSRVLGVLGLGRTGLDILVVPPHPQGRRNVTMEAPPVALFDSLKVRIASRFCNSHRHLCCGISSIIKRAVCSGFKLLPFLFLLRCGSKSYYLVEWI
jgi:hypothetical protein